MVTLLLIGVALWYAWRYSKTDIDPDWAMFNLYNFTGAVYGVHFVDCKSPLIHLYYALLGKLCGKNIPRIKFLHHVIISLPGIIVGGWAGLAFIVGINSGWMLAFHGNVGQIPAGLILLAITFNSYEEVAAVCLITAILFEPKLFPALLLVLVYPHLFLYIGILLFWLMVVALLLWKYFPSIWNILWEANITITKRMSQMRYRILRMGQHDYTLSAGIGAMYVLPWVFWAMSTHVDPLYWIVPTLYMAEIAGGLAVRANHFIVLWAFIAPMLPWQAALALFIVDMITAFGYWKNIWRRFYAGLEGVNKDAKQIGLWLKDKAGEVWVNGLHTGVYIYAEKAPIGGLCEQIEIRENATERREKWREYFKAHPPEWVVQSYEPGWTFKGVGYREVAKTDVGSVVYRRL